MLKIPKLEYDQKKSIFIGLSILLIVSLSVSGFFLFRYNSIKDNLIDGQQSSEKETEELIKKIGKIYELPKGETPTVATVADPNRLKNQPFFSNAQVGDKVLVYINDRKGILYRPSTNQIINISPIDINKQAVTSSPTKSPDEVPQTMKIVLYNGTQNNGLANKFEKILKQKVTDITFTVVKKGNAQKSDYKLTQVIDLKGNLDKQVTRIASIIDAENAKLPPNEKSPNTDADILIIIGTDYSTTPTTSNILPSASE